MVIIQSFIRIKFNHYRMIARAIVPASKEITSLKKTFCDLPGSTISKLKELNSNVFLKVNLGTLLVFLKFARGSGTDAGRMGTIICCYLSHFNISNLRAVM